MQASLYVQVFCTTLAKSCFLATNNTLLATDRQKLVMSEQFQIVQATYLLVTQFGYQLMQLLATNTSVVGYRYTISLTNTNLRMRTKACGCAVSKISY